LLSAVMYGIEPTIREYALSAGVPVSVSLVVSSMIIVLIFAVTCLIRRRNIRLPFRQIILLVALGVLMYATSALLGMAYSYIPVGCATVIHFTYPTLVCLAMTVFFKEKLTPLRVAAMVLSVAGLMCITGGIQGALAGIGLAFCSSITYVCYILIMDHLPETLPLDVKMLYVAAACMVTSILFLGKDPAFETVNAATIPYLGLCGIFGAVAIACFSFGVQRVGAASASFFSLFEPVTSVVVSTVVYHYEFTFVMLLGCVLSIGAVLCISIGDMKQSRSVQQADNG